VIWALSAGHALGAGSDASKLWLRAVVFAPSVPVVYLFVLRLAPRRSSEARRREPVPVPADARPRSMPEAHAPTAPPSGAADHRPDSPTPASVGV